MKLYLARHAQSFNNANIDHPGVREPDPPLTELGRSQAARLAAYLEAAAEPDQLSDMLAWRYGGREALSYKITRMVTSPMLRALQTAKPLAARLNVPVKVWWDVCERGGVFNYQGGEARGLPGLRRSQIREAFPDYDLPPRISENGWWRGNNESREATRLRAEEVARRLRVRAAEDWQDEHVLMVSHAGFMDALVKALVTDLTPAGDAVTFLFFYNTSLSRLDFMPEGVGVRYLNRLSHLPDEMIS